MSGHVISLLRQRINSLFGIDRFFGFLSINRLHALEQFHKEDPDDPFTRFALAQEYIKAGEISRGRSLYESLVVDHPDYIGTYYHLGKLYEALDLPKNARETYELGIVTANRLRDAHARSELNDALLQLSGVGFD